ncbi:MAG: hypothetical protein IPJ34_10895 [Myxococcales bacterium]|nr:hypothetical protein [Myxococcales bacterium]
MMDGPTTSMKITPWYAAALSPFVVLAMTGVLTGHAWVAQLAVLMVVFAIFFGTLSLGRLSRAAEEQPRPLQRPLEEALGDAE